MKIGIDCRMWDETGVGMYIKNIVGELARLDRHNQYVLFMLEKDFGKIDLPENFKKVKANVKWHTFSEQFILLFIFLRQNLDLLHVPHFNIPILYPKKLVVTVHDLTIWKVKTGRASTRSYLRYSIWRIGFKIALFVSVWRSKVIFTVSEYVREDICRTLKVNKEKIMVAPNALPNDFLANLDSGENNSQQIMEKYGIQKPYLFYVGNAHPHKNLERLLKAFEKISLGSPELNLVLGGKKYFFYERLEDEWKGSRVFKNLKFTGFIEEEDLPALYKNAELFVNPSLQEGFGIQLLEAFACKTAVACSNATSLPEIGGDAAYYFDPEDVDDIAEKISFILTQDHREKINKGLERLKHYSWQESAKLILEGYEQA